MQPVLVEVTRGGRVESLHAVDAVVVDDSGRIVASHGDAETPRYPRSAIKAMLALPLAEAGLAGMPDASAAARALCLACASHAGEPVHLEVARAMLASCGRDEAALACGTHWPLSRAAADALVREGRFPCAVHNNCSGKHAAMICLSAAMDADPAGYVGPAHPAMRLATAALEELTGTRCDDANRAIDGCAFPTYAIPLERLAHAFARFGTGRGLAPGRAAAAASLRRAVASHPVLLSGTGRFDTEMTARHGEAVFVKGGAEGVWCASVPSAGIGIALKARDGGGRAAQGAIALLVARALDLPPPAPVELLNWNGQAVGAVRARL